MNKKLSKNILKWNRLQLGRYIRAVTGHNNLLYHLHNIDKDISPSCRFCLDDREEFFHLMFHCPALWFERHEINAKEPDHAHPDAWTPQQIIDFTFFPRINDAFARPLYVMDGARQETPPSPRPSSQRADDPDQPRMLDSDTDAASDVSVMDVSSLADSTSLSASNSAKSVL